MLKLSFFINSLLLSESVIGERKKYDFQLFTVFFFLADRGAEICETFFHSLTCAQDKKAVATENNRFRLSAEIPKKIVSTRLCELCVNETT